MVKKKSHNWIGSIAFLAGVLLAAVFALIIPSGPTYDWIVWLLVIIGVIVGLLNIAVEEIQPFLFAGTIFVIVAALGKDAFGNIGFVLQFLKNLLTLFVPATLIVALRSIWSLGRE